MMRKQLFLLVIFLSVFGSCEIKYKEHKTVKAKTQIYSVQTALLNDFENDFTNEQKEELGKLLLEFDSVSSNKIVFLSIEACDENLSFQDYVSNLAQKWHIDQNNGGKTILLVFSKKKRKIAMSNGINVTNFSEIDANKIISEKVIPAFKDNNYYLGIKECIAEMIHKWK